MTRPDENFYQLLLNDRGGRTGEYWARGRGSTDRVQIFSSTAHAREVSK